MIRNWRLRFEKFIQEDLNSRMGKKAQKPRALEVETIYGKRAARNGRTEYWIKWKGFPEKDSTWEEATNVTTLTLSYKLSARNCSNHCTAFQRTTGIPNHTHFLLPLLYYSHSCICPNSCFCAIAPVYFVWLPCGSRVARVPSICDTLLIQSAYLHVLI